MEYNEYKEALLCAAETLNERMGTEFSEDNLVLRCFQTENQQEVFEQFCKQYFPDRLTDQYKEDGYLTFMLPPLLVKARTVWTESFCAQMLKDPPQRSITSCCMSWRISSVPAMSLAEITSTNATAWMIL